MVVRESEYVSGTVITYEAAFDHSDAGVGLCLQLPKALVLQKFVDMSLDKNISVHFVFTCPNNTSEFEALHGYITYSMIKFYTSGSCKILVSHFGPTVARRNTYACQVEPNAEHCQVPWTQSDKTLNMCFPAQWVNFVTLLESCKIYLSSIASTFDDPMDVTELQR